MYVRKRFFTVKGDVNVFLPWVLNSTATWEKRFCSSVCTQLLFAGFPVAFCTFKSLFLYRKVARVSKIYEMFLAHHDNSEYWTYVCMHCEGWNWVYLEKAEHCVPRWSHTDINPHPQIPEIPVLSATSELILTTVLAQIFPLDLAMTASLLQVCSKITFMTSSLWLMFFQEENDISQFILEKFIRISTPSSAIF